MHSEYEYPDAGSLWNDDYIWKEASALLQRIAEPGTRVFELGCGNGAMAARMKERGLRVTAVDPSTSGIRVATAAHPGIEFHLASTEDALAVRFGHFPLVVSFEVIEHCYSPLRFARCAFELLDDGGWLILSTPYHGYFKNLALALTGKLDNHFGALWEGGHIKFFSIRTIRALLAGVGFQAVRVVCVGRIPGFAKSMIVTARKLAPPS